MDIIYRSATQLAADIKSGKTSAARVLEAHLEQIEKYNPGLNAVVNMDIESARQRAAEADQALEDGQARGPLHGVPFTLKDAHSTTGLPTTAGYPPLADYVAEKDSTVTSRLKAAGGILMGKTNVSRLLADIQSRNPVYGRTDNPWDLKRTPGGSSGGAAAALAAGMTPFEMGSDLGGSIRIPAHFCGLFGLKTTEHRIPGTGHIPDLPDKPRSLRHLACLGPMARTPEDLILIYRILSGPDGIDSEVPPVPAPSPPDLNMADLNIAYTQDFGCFPVSSRIQSAFNGLIEQLRPRCNTAAGSLPRDMDAAQDVQRARDLTRISLSAFREDSDQPPTLLREYFLALHHRDHAIARWETFFQEWDVFLTPVSITSAFPHCDMETPLMVDGEKRDYWTANAHCKLFNYTGHPVVVIPLDPPDGGLPLGVQIVGPRWGESRLLSAAREISRLAGGFQRPPGY